MPTGVASPSAGTGVLRGKVHSNFWRTHLSEVDASSARYAHAFEQITDDVGDIETVGYWEAPGEAKIWPDEQARSYQGFKSNSFTVVTRRWQDGIEWPLQLKENDRTKSLVDVAREKGRSFGRIPRRCFFQILQGSTDTDLLPTVPNAPDGGAFYSASDGSSADRFGLSGGNIQSGTGVTTVAKIVTDFYLATSRFLRFVNSGGRPVFDESIFDGGFIIYFNPALQEVFQTAFKGQMVPATGGAAVAQTNVLVTATGWTVELRPSPEITTNDWFIFLRTVPDGKKPLVWTRAREVEETPYTKASGSDRARDYDVEGLGWDSRWGFGCALPWVTVKVDN